VKRQTLGKSMDVTTVALAAHTSAETGKLASAMIATTGTRVMNGRPARGSNAGIGSLPANVLSAAVAATARIGGHGRMTPPPAAI
jgi:hypothetical protein